MSQDGVANIPIGLYLYSDKAKLGQFGSLKSYPVIGRLSCLPSEIRNGQGPGGARVLAWLPVVCVAKLIMPMTISKALEPGRWHSRRTGQHRCSRIQACSLSWLYAEGIAAP